MPHRLNIIGPGKVGRTLASLWKRSGFFSIQDVLSSTPEGSRAAVRSIGAGKAAGRLEDMHPAKVWMITPPDDRIVACAVALAGSGALHAGDVIFHCSGALSSLDLRPVAACGAYVASVHPVKPFPESAASEFSGTWCAAEGDVAALALLEPAFQHIGGRVTRIDAKAKLIYHAGNVIASNYLVALVEAALRCYAGAGIARENAIEMLDPLLRDTVRSIIRLGTAQALTGPIARGDADLVSRQLSRLAREDPRLDRLYRALGAFAVELARRKEGAGTAALEAIEGCLADSSRDGAAS